jgi:hypothetical protein
MKWQLADLNVAVTIAFIFRCDFRGVAWKLIAKTWASSNPRPRCVLCTHDDHHATSKAAMPQPIAKAKAYPARRSISGSLRLALV